MKRILAILLSLTMLFSYMPASAFAADGETDGGGQTEVEKTDISTLTLGYYPKSITYDGTAQNLSTLYLEESNPHKSLQKDIDFTVEVTNNINVGDMVVTLRGIGAYCGEVQLIIPILPKDIKGCFYVVDKYTEEGHKPGIKLSFGSTALIENVDYQVTDYTEKEDKGVVTVKGIGNYTGTKSINYTVGRDIARADATLYQDGEFVYTGRYQFPSVKVTYNGERLRESYDYKTTYKNHMEVGTATITITGIGKFHGEKEIHFTIKGKEQKVTPAKAVYDAYIRSQPFKIEAEATGDGTGFSYTSSNPAVVTVDAEGMVHAHSEGTAVVTLRTVGMKGYAEASAQVTVNVKRSSIDFGTILAEEKGLSASINKLTAEKIVSASVFIGETEYSCKIEDKGTQALIKATYPEQKKGREIKIVVKDDLDKEITKTVKVKNAVIELSVNKIYDKSTSIKGKTYPGMTVKTVLNGKLYQTKAGSGGAFSLKIPKQKIGKSIKITVISENGSTKSISKKVYKRTGSSVASKYYVLRTSKYVYVRCRGASQGDVIKVKINGKIYKKKIGKTSGSPTVKFYTGKHTTGSAVYMYLYNSHNQKICSRKTKVYFGNKLYVGMTSSQALQTTWGKPIARYQYPGYQIWLFQSGETVGYACIQGGKVTEVGYIY